MSILPYLNADCQLEDGSYIHLLPFCKKNCASGLCKKYYESLTDSTSGSHCCPYGLSSYIFDSPSGKIIFSGLRIKGSYNKKIAKTTCASEYIFNPLIEEGACLSIAKEVYVSLKERAELETKLEAIRDLLHETRALNGQIKNSIDLLWESNPDEYSIEMDILLETLMNAHVSSFMISNRFSYFDSILNPSLSVGSPYPAVIFKKFDKMRRLLKGYMRKNVWISVISPNQSNYKYNIYPTFETLLFIILENAIKYSPNNKSVDVKFHEVGSILDVSIESLGPYCNENEIVHLCDKGFRGENAVAFQDNGQGFGLNFAKRICEMHHIVISFNSIYSHKDHGVKFGTFIVNLHFDNSNTIID